MKAKPSKPRVNGHDAEPANGTAHRDAHGLFLPGHGLAGPGRPPKTISEYLLDAARQLAEPMEAAKDAVSIARELAPAALVRAFEILHDPATEPRDQLAAADMILSRGYGLPTQASAVLNFNANDMTQEQREQAKAAGAAALARLLALARPPQAAPPIEGDPNG